MSVLGREVAALDEVVHRATVLHALLVAGEERFLVAAADDLEDASANLGQLEALRSIVVADAAEELGLPEEGVTLRLLAQHSDPTTAELLGRFGTRLSQLLGEVQELVRGAGELAHAGVGNVRGVLERLATGATTPVYGAAAGPAATAPARFDQHA